MANAEVQDAVASAVEKELDEGRFIMQRLRQRLNAFEDEYGMETEEFVEKFEEGEIGDDQDFFEWYAAYKGVKHWEEKTEKLKEAA